MGIIRFCELCWWKEIENTTTLLYLSTKKCNCLYKFHKSIEIIICETMNTTEWPCAHCTLKSNFNGSKVKHIYLYPNRYEEDFEIFFACPKKRQIKSYPKTHINLRCIKYLCTQESCDNTGYTWFCQLRHMNQFTSDEDNRQLTINPHEEMMNSCIFWQCIKCSKLQINYFNDQQQNTISFQCLHCNFFFSFNPFSTSALLPNMSLEMEC